MQKKLLTTLTLFFALTGFLLAQDQPKSCNNAASPFNDIMKGKITSQVRTAHQYYMNSTDPAAGSNYEERTANLQKEIAKTFQLFMSSRRNEYRNTICNYYKTDWNKPGNSSKRTLKVQPGFYLLKNTLKRTENGDWKGGPTWKPNSKFPTSITWKTGGHRRSETFVEIQAKYTEDFIQKTVIAELNIARKELNDLGIPTEIPPFLQD